MSQHAINTEAIQPIESDRLGFIKRLWRMDTAMELCSAILIYSGIYDTTFLYTVFSTMLKWKKVVLNA